MVGKYSLRGSDKGRSQTMKGYLNCIKKFGVSVFSIQCRLYWSGKLGGRKTSQCFRREMVMAWTKQCEDLEAQGKGKKMNLRNVDEVESTVGGDWLVGEVKSKVQFCDFFFFLATCWKGGEETQKGWRRLSWSRVEEGKIMTVMFGHTESEVSFEMFKGHWSVSGFTDLELRENMCQRYIFIYMCVCVYHLYIGGF